jgi:uncharacterized protein YbjT (DUF2867 family)
MQNTQTQSWMITGANGNLGKRLIGELLQDPANRVVAVVRSERAQQAIERLSFAAQQSERLSIVILDYADVAALHQVALLCNKAVHLVGILKQTKQASFHQAHEESTGALLEALKDTPVDHLTYLSIVGSSPDSDNACLASKGRAEKLCLDAALPACVIRVPMVLGEGDYASFALQKRACQSLAFTFRADSLEQPIYAGDVVAAIIAAGKKTVNGSLDLGGAEVLTRRALTQRAGAVLGCNPRLVSLPISLGLMLASVMERVLPNPPVTAAMLDVLDHDDSIDPQAAMQALGLSELTSLDATLAAVLTG